MNKKYSKNILQLILCITLILSLTGCASKDKKRPVMNIDMVTGEDGNTYMKKDGEEQIKFQVEAGEIHEVKIKVSHIEGSVSMKIYKTGDEDNAIYEGNDIPDSEFIVNVKESGDYTIWIEAKDFVGEYSCNI